MSVAPGTDIAGLMARLNELYPRANLAAQRYGVALNRSYAPLTAVLADGDEVALIPPVSGGAANALRCSQAVRDQRPAVVAG